MPKIKLKDQSIIMKSIAKVKGDFSTGSPFTWTKKQREA